MADSRFLSPQGLPLLAACALSAAALALVTTTGTTRPTSAPGAVPASSASTLRAQSVGDGATGPTALHLDATGADVVVSWAAADEAAHYLVTRTAEGSTSSASVDGTTYADSAITPGTTYTYSVAATDDAGNVSTTLGPLSVTAAPSSSATGSAPAGSESSAVAPGAATSTAGAGNGGATAAVTLSSTRGLLGAATGGATGSAPLLLSTPGSTSADPLPVSVGTTPTALSGSAVVYYKTSWTSPHAHYQVGSGEWTAVPGVAMTTACAGWATTTVPLGSATTGQIVFNDGSGTWDNHGGNNYPLTPGIQVVQDGAVSAPSSGPCTTVDVTAPTVPTNVVASAAGSSVSVSWSASSDATGVTGYTVTRSGGAGTVTSQTATPGLTDTAVVAGNTYSYVVRAFDAAGNTSAASPAASVTVPTGASQGGGADTTRPTAPTHLTGTATSAGNALSWTAATDDVAVSGYVVVRTGGGLPATRSVTTTAFTDADVVAGTTYRYSVMTVDTSGNVSAQAGPVAVVALEVAGGGDDGGNGGGSDDGGDVPTDAAVVYYKTSWTSPYAHYQVGSGTWTTAPGTAMTAACDSWYTITIPLGTATTGQIVFNNGSGTWDNHGGNNYPLAVGIQYVQDGTITSRTASPCAPVVPDTTAPSTPSGLKATVDGVRITVSWTPSTDDRLVTGYTVTRTGGAGTVTRDVTTPYATDAGLQEQTIYTYVVRAFDAAGNTSGQSAAVSVTTTTKPIEPDVPDGAPLGGDPREDSIYFVMTARFYDGVPSNDRGGSQNISSGNAANDDPMFRGDFQGLMDKLGYIKALGFSAIWITPVVLNRSDYDFHGYHGWDFYRVDTRLETPGASYQELINAAHAQGIKIFQDVVYNHSSRWGAKGLFVPTVWGSDTGQWSWMYSTKQAGQEYDPMVENQGDNPNLTAAQNTLATGRPYNGDLWSSTAPAGNTCTGFGTPTGGFSPEGFALQSCQWPSPTSGMFPATYYHQCWIGNWEGEDAQDCWLADDLADLNTESKPVQDYLIGAYDKYIDMGVDGFRVDTAVHVPRLTWNRVFLPALQEHALARWGEKGKDFYVFGEVGAFVNDKWNRGSVNHSAQFYTWKERKTYPADDRTAATEAYNYEEQLGTGNQPTSDNAFLTGTDGNTYHTPDHSKFSGMNVIDMRMHMNFSDANNAFWNGKDSDDSYNDATYNVVYVDSHDYGPNKSSTRYTGGTDAWAENMSLMWTFRGIPTLYYGSEIEFQAGKQIDCGPTCPLATTGRAYYGDHVAGTITATDFGVVGTATGAVAATMQQPLVKHLQRLNQIRRAIPALQKGEYSTTGVSGNIAYKRRFTEGSVDSFVLVTVTDGATFSRIPDGTYVDAVTGDTKVVTNGTLTVGAPGKGNMRAYVLNLPGNPAPGKVGVAGPYLR